MKREEKNRLTRRRIMDSALAEFSGRGYGAGSLNTICAAGRISKGIIYHYFRNKDELYLACVEECFQLLTQRLRVCLTAEQTTPEAQLDSYFRIRMDLFRELPVYQPIFCEAVVSPPAHLKAEIQRRKQPFDEMNNAILEKILNPLPLRSGVTRAEVTETFRLFQDFINAHYQTAGMSPQEFAQRDSRCRKAMEILLFGSVERKETSNV